MDNNLFLRNYLSELYISIETVQHVQCSSNWSSHNYTAPFSSIGFICHGEGWIKVNDVDLYPKKGQLYLLPANTMQSFSPINNTPYNKYYCHFNAKAGNVNIFDIIKTPLCIDIDDSDKVINLFKDLLDTFNKNDVTSLLKTKLLLLELLVIYFTKCDENKIKFVTQASNIHMEKAINYIENNLKEDLNIEKIAEVTSYHPCYFTKIFKDTFSMSPIQFITKKRLEKSMLLLTTSNLSVTEISYEVGFNSQFYFSNIFKKKTGLSPTEYRSAYNINL